LKINLNKTFFFTELLN